MQIEETFLFTGEYTHKRSWKHCCETLFGSLKPSLVFILWVLVASPQYSSPLCFPTWMRLVWNLILIPLSNSMAYKLIVYSYSPRLFWLSLLISSNATVWFQDVLKITSKLKEPKFASAHQCNRHSGRTILKRYETKPHQNLKVSLLNQSFRYQNVVIEFSLFLRPL